MNRFDQAIAQTGTRGVEANKVLKNTYLLLSATLAFSAVMAMVSMAVNVSPIMSLFALGGGMLLGMFVLPRTANSASGIGVIFLVTGLLGFSLGPMLNFYAGLPKGPEIIATAFGGTGVIFLGLSGYALTTKRDFSFMGGFLMAGFMVVLLAAIANIFLEMPVASLAISAAIIMLMSGVILFDTSRIIHGGETNYIMATMSLYIAIFNIFVHLLNLLGVLSNDD